jgi:hypothetical protein
MGKEGIVAGLDHGGWLHLALEVAMQRTETGAKGRRGTQTGEAVAEALDARQKEREVPGYVCPDCLSC